MTKSTTAKKATATRTVPKVATTAARPIAPGEVRGQVRGPNRKGLSNARVELIDLAGNRIRGRSTTGSDGQYSIKAPAGRYRLKAGHSSALAAAKSITVPAGAAVRHDFDLRKTQAAVQKTVKRPVPTLAKSKTTTRTTPALRPPSKSAPAIAGGGLRGRVTDAKTKRPVAGAKVSISGGSPNVQRAVGTDRQGNYAVGSLPPGRYRVAVSKSGYSQVAGNLGVQSGKSTNFSVRLPVATSKQAIAARKPASQTRRVVPKFQVRQGRLTGRIVDAGNERYIPGATVNISGRQNVGTNSTGTYSVNLAPGNYRVTVSKSGYAGASANVAVRSGQTATASFRLNPLKRAPVVIQPRVVPKK